MATGRWADGQTPSDDEIAAVGRAWIDYHRTRTQRDWWAVETVIEAVELEVAWRLVLTLCHLADPQDLRLVSNIGAGPLEDLIRRHSDHAMDLIEPAVASNHTLLIALAGVWGWDEPVRPRVNRVLAAHGQELL